MSPPYDTRSGSSVRSGSGSAKRGAENAVGRAAPPSAPRRRVGVRGERQARVRARPCDGSSYRPRACTRSVTPRLLA